MQWEEFFKPTLLKIILTLLLFIILNAIHYSNGGWGVQGCPIPNGFPFPFYFEDVNCASSKGSARFEGFESTNEFHAVGLFIDLVVYYLIALISISFYKKMKTK